ncbi:MAG: hypothetical protein JW709_01090 [Sedimentisphaerales bacterium]|nr:hypothetical protein [Sedimentisphaerales bacterium]
MAKTSIWKRMGGWLRGSTEPVQSGQTLDADGLLVTPSENHLETPTPQTAEATSLFHRRSKTDQIAAMEEGFNRLVEVLESINEHVVQQREISSSVRTHLEKLPNLLDGFAQTINGQRQLLNTMTEELQQGNRLGRQQTELLKQLPDAAREQLGRLDQMQEHLEKSSRAAREVAENVGRQRQTAEAMATQSQAQTQALHDLKELIHHDDERLEILLSRHTRRLTWLSIVAGLVALIAAGVAFAVWWSHHQ